MWPKIREIQLKPHRALLCLGILVWIMIDFSDGYQILPATGIPHKWNQIYGKQHYPNFKPIKWEDGKFGKADQDSNVMPDSNEPLNAHTNNSPYLHAQFKGFPTQFGLAKEFYTSSQSDPKKKHFHSYKAPKKAHLPHYKFTEETSYSKIPKKKHFRNSVYPYLGAVAGDQSEADSKPQPESESEDYVEEEKEDSSSTGLEEDSAIEQEEEPEQQEKPKPKPELKPRYPPPYKPKHKFKPKPKPKKNDKKKHFYDYIEHEVAFQPEKYPKHQIHSYAHEPAILHGWGLHSQFQHVPNWHKHIKNKTPKKDDDVPQLGDE